MQIDWLKRRGCPAGTQHHLPEPPLPHGAIEVTGRREKGTVTPPHQVLREALDAGLRKGTARLRLEVRVHAAA